VAEALLEPVAAGQTRFRMQGLAPDARGIAVGREVVIVLPSLDRVVGFLGAYSDEASLDELVPTLTIERARREGGGHALLVRSAAPDAYGVDRLARIAGACRGQTYTGAASSFVRWRDRMAPFGYDLIEPIAASTDQVVVVDPEQRTDYRTLDAIDPIELIQRLELRPDPLPGGAVSGDPELAGLRDLALALVAPGLAERVLHYLWRHDDPVGGHYVRLKDDARPSLLLRLRSPDPRRLEVLAGIPGVELLAPVSARAAVEVGWRHPIHLPSASACFPGDEMFLFRGRARRVERIDGAPRFIDVRHLVRREGTGEAITVAPLDPAEFEPLRVQLRLRASAAPREPRGALVPWEQAHLLRRIVYLVPPSALHAARVVLLREGIVVVAGASTTGRSAITAAGLSVAAVMPLGLRLVEAGPGVLAPDGWEFWPRVRPELLRELLGLAGDDLGLVLDPKAAPLRVRADQLLPLDAGLVGRLALVDVDAIESELPALAPGTLRNEPLARWVLWGFRGGAGERAEGGARDEG
jgi:hypothetical protein